MSLMIDPIGNLVWTNEKGKWHREKGPAIIWVNGLIQYRLNGNIHRLDGPAVIDYNGNKSYWINGSLYTKEEYYTKIKKL